MYFDKPNLHEFFSLNYIDIYKKIVVAADYTNDEYVYYSSIMSSIIHDINVQQDFNANFIRRKLRQLPEYDSWKTDKTDKTDKTNKNDVLLFFNVLARFYEIELSPSSIDKSRILVKNKADEMLEYLRSFLQKNKNGPGIWRLILTCKDKLMVESLIFTYFEFHSLRSNLLQKYKMYYFYTEEA